MESPGTAAVAHLAWPAGGILPTACEQGVDRARTHAGRGWREGLGEKKGALTHCQTPLCPQMAEGQELKDKSRLRYPINGAQGWVLLLELHGWGGAPSLAGLTPGPKLLYVSLPPGTDLGESHCPSAHPCPPPPPTAFAATLHRSSR